MDYVPDRGHLVWLSFDPQAGHEQSGRRPAVVVSPALYNSQSDLAIFCPVTSRPKGYPFEVQVPDGLGIQGVILADQVRSLDWRARDVSFIAKIPDESVAEVIELLTLLLSS